MHVQTECIYTRLQKQNKKYLTSSFAVQSGSSIYSTLPCVRDLGDNDHIKIMDLRFSAHFHLTESLWYILDNIVYFIF